MKKLILGAVALAVTLLGFGGLSAPSTQASPESLVAISPIMLSSVLGADAFDGIGPNGADATDDIATLAAALGDEDGILEPEDLEDLDFDGNQLDWDGDSTLALFVFVEDDDAAVVDPKTELTVSVDDWDGTSDDTSGDGDLTCDDGTVDGFDDEDCDGDGGIGDGVFVVYLVPEDTSNDDTQGETVNVEVTQEGVTLDIDINIVGNPDEITIGEVKEVASIENEGCGSADYTDGLDNDEDGDKIFMWATVVDSEGTELAMISVDWDVDDADIADIADDSSVTVASEITAAFAVLCGQDDTGEVTVTASFDDTGNGGEEESATATKTIVGLPENISLSASPATIACDGVNSSTVTATVTDADGNNVVDGTSVTFSVVALGTANPINTTTTDGQASSTITPLSGNVAGTTVTVSAGDAISQIRIDCLQPTPTAAPAPPTPAGPITPPDTGNGGYLAQDASGSFSWLAIAGLALGALALTLGGAAVRKVTR